MKAKKNCSLEFAHWIMRLKRCMRDNDFNEKAIGTLDIVAFHHYFADGETPEDALHEETTCS